MQQDQASQDFVSPFALESLSSSIDLYNFQEQEARLAAMRVAGLSPSFSQYPLHNGLMHPSNNLMFPSRAASYPFPSPPLSFYQQSSQFPPGTVDPRLTSSPPGMTYNIHSDPSYNSSAQQFWHPGPSPNLPGDRFPVPPSFLNHSQLLPQGQTASNGGAFTAEHTSMYSQLQQDSQPRQAHTTVKQSNNPQSRDTNNSMPPPDSTDLVKAELSPDSLRGQRRSSSSHVSLLTSQSISDTSGKPAPPPKAKALRQTTRRAKRRRLSDHELSDDDEDSDDMDDDEPRTAVKKFHKACASCRKQKGKCVKKENEDKCRMCKNRNLPCVFELRPERKQPVQRKVLIEELRKKDAVIESLRQMLKPYMLNVQSGSENPSSCSPPSSAAHEEPLRMQVLEWLNKAEQSKAADFSLDSRAYNDDSSSGDERQTHGKSTLARPMQANQPSRSRSPKTRSHFDNHPVGLLARESLRGSNGKYSQPPSSADTGEHSMSPSDVGVACHGYFGSSSSLAARVNHLGLRKIEIDRGLSEEPKLLRKGLIVPSEVDKLFNIFYEKLNVAVSLLDPVLHTPATTFARCPLLFTVVCAVASRYYTERPELYSIAMHFAMTSAASSLMDSKKSVELCQAYLLLSVWPLPSRKHDEDRAWLYLGLAIRMAMDLNLHLPTQADMVSEQQEREVLNRTRTWIICYNMDRSSSAQLGKPMTIRENYMIRSSADWYKRSKYNLPYDIHLCQLTGLMRLMSRFQETVYADVNNPTGVKDDLDLREIAFSFDDEILAWETSTMELFAKESDPNDPGCVYRAQLLPFYANYSRLVILSFGFQYSFRRGLLAPNNELIRRCLDAASNVINRMVNDMALTPYLRYAPDGHLVFVSFAAAFLLKLLRLKFAFLLDDSQRVGIIPLIERLIATLGDENIVIDESHTPKIYSRFLAGLLEKHRNLSVPPTPNSASPNSLTIDVNVAQEPFPSSGSPHPSIQVTPPPGSEHMTFEFVIRKPTLDLLNDEAHDDNSTGPYNDTHPSSSIDPSGSVTVHPMEEPPREDEDEDMLLPLKAINDPAFWLHGMVPWPEISMPGGNSTPPTMTQALPVDSHTSFNYWDHELMTTMAH